MTSAALLSVGEVSRRSGVAVSALHYYEAQGLISAERSSGNQRRYRRSALRRIAVIRVGQALGVSLAEIAEELGRLPDQRAPTKADWARMSSHWRVSLDRRIADLEALRDHLQGCIGCGCLSLRICQLHNPDDALARRGPGARRLVSRDDDDRPAS